MLPSKPIRRLSKWLKVKQQDGDIKLVRAISTGQANGARLRREQAATMGFAHGNKDVCPERKDEAKS